ncbi:hypothetical protein NSR00_12155 [Aeribacillus sp. FSL K6-8394]|uniref:hypothetical protein n=1 Tax=Aeribacillus sp. FSL K6-8394 TaxID=2954570 RepID=UPI0030F858EF
MYKPVLLSVLVFSAEDLPIVSKQSSCMLNVQEKMSYYTGSVINHDLSLSSHAKNKSTGDLKKNFNGKNGREGDFSQHHAPCQASWMNTYAAIHATSQNMGLSSQNPLKIKHHKH